MGCFSALLACKRHAVLALLTAMLHNVQKDPGICTCTVWPVYDMIYHTRLVCLCVMLEQMTAYNVTNYTRNYASPLSRDPILPGPCPPRKLGAYWGAKSEIIAVSCRTTPCPKHVSFAAPLQECGETGSPSVRTCPHFWISNVFLLTGKS